MQTDTCRCQSEVDNVSQYLAGHNLNSSVVVAAALIGERRRRTTARSSCTEIVNSVCLTLYSQLVLATETDGVIQCYLLYWSLCLSTDC